MTDTVVIPPTPTPAVSPLMAIIGIILTAIASALAGNRFGPTPDPKPVPDKVVPDKKEEPKPTPDVVPPRPQPTTPLEIKITDSAGIEALFITPNQPMLVSCVGTNKEWTNSTGKAKVIPTAEGFVIVPTETDTLVFSVRVGTSTAIKVVGPKPVEPETKPSPLQLKVDAVEKEVKTVSDNLKVTDGKVTDLDSKTTQGLGLVERILTSLDLRITALEAPRPPPKPFPDPNPVVTPKTLRIVVVEPLNAAGNAVNRTGAVVSFLNRLAAWQSKHSYRIYPTNSPETEAQKAVADLARVPLPALAVYDQSNGKFLSSIALTSLKFEEFETTIKNLGG